MQLNDVDVAFVEPHFMYLHKGTGSRFKLSNLFSFNIISSISFSIQSSNKITSTYKSINNLV